MARPETPIRIIITGATRIAKSRLLDDFLLDAIRAAGLSYSVNPGDVQTFGRPRRTIRRTLELVITNDFGAAVKLESSERPLDRRAER